MAVEERQDECADVRAVDVRVRHHDDAVVPELRDVELVSDPRSDHLHEKLDLRVRENLVDAVLLRVDDLSAQRQDRLVRLVARLLRGAAGGVALDDKELRKLRIANLAVGELLCDVAAECTFAPRQIASLARSLTRARGRDRFRDDLLRVRRVLLEELGELRVHRRFHEALHPRVAELRLRLSFELRLLKLQGDDRGESFAYVFALEIVLFLLQQPLVPRDLVERASERGVESGKV